MRSDTFPDRRTLQTHCTLTLTLLAHRAPLSPSSQAAIVTVLELTMFAV